MGKFQRLILFLCGVGVLGQSLWLWQSTGRRWFTQYYRADLDPANIVKTDLDRTLEVAGLYDAAGEPEIVDFQFRLGLVPSGFGKHALSVFSVGGPGILIMGTALWPCKRNRPTDRGAVPAQGGT